MKAFFSMAGAVLLCGCNTIPPLPAVDLTQKGWVIQEGQAVWKPGAQTPELAGEVLLATRLPDHTFVQFTKSPFPLISAQTIGARWEARIPFRDERFSGCGRPPRRLLWLYLAPALLGDPLPRGLRWHATGDTWRLENTNRAEYIEGFLAP